MKKCTCCGREYPDDATTCANDQQPLVPVEPKPPIEPPQPASTPDQVNLAASALRSVNGATGALVGVAAPVAYVFAAMATEMNVGRPSPNQIAGAVVFVLPILGGLGALLGAVLGLVVRLLVSRTALAGPTDRRMVAGAIALVVLMGGARAFEPRPAPRPASNPG